MGQMFEYATSFGYYFESFRFDDDPSVVWDTSNVVNMESMFRHCLHLTSVPFHWDVSSVTSMARMFEGADNFRPEAFADWNTSSVTDFSYLLAMNDPQSSYYWGSEGTWSNSNRMINVHSWDVSSAKTLEGMFYNNQRNFNGGVSNNELMYWDVSGVTNMRAMFSMCSEFVGTIQALTDGILRMWNLWTECFTGRLLLLVAYRPGTLHKLNRCRKCFVTRRRITKISPAGPSLP